MGNMLLTNVEKSLTLLKKEFGESKDLISKNFFIGNFKAIVLYLNGLSDVPQVNQFVLEASKIIVSYEETLEIKEGLKSKENEIEKEKKCKETGNRNILDFVLENVLEISEVKKESKFENVVDEITKGKAVVLVEGEKEALILGTDKFKERAITEPPTSSILKGPRSGFNENIKTNLSCIRKILATSDLRVEYLNIGKFTKTSIAIVYLNAVADKKVVNEIKDRINQIDIDGVIDSFYIASFLEPRKNSMFKQVGTTEKPDIACAKVLEGRVLIMVDGSPIVLTLPYILLEDLQSSGDYYGQHFNASFLRIIRFVSLLITILLPGMYIAVKLHHYKSIPLTFLTTIINTTQELPLTPFAEIIFVLILFEILYETSLRMPKYLGLALSVVGALILGDTAVKAGIISPPAVMFVAVSGITQYTTPDLHSQLSLLRFGFTLAGGALGFYGIILLFIFIIHYLNDFDSYGTAYLSPFSPYHKEDMQDAFFKTDITKLKNRPISIPNKNKKRLKGVWKK